MWERAVLTNRPSLDLSPFGRGFNGKARAAALPSLAVEELRRRRVAQVEELLKLRIHGTMPGTSLPRLMAPPCAP